MRIIAATVLLLASFTAGALDLKGVSPGQPWEPQSSRINSGWTGEDRWSDSKMTGPLLVDRIVVAGSHLMERAQG